MSPLSEISRARARQRIAQLTRQRQAVERVLLERPALLKGTLIEVQRTCGKPGCKCARGHKHTCWQLSASVEGKARTWNVPRRYLAKVKRLTDNYRRFRRARAAWVRLNAQMLEVINEMEAARTVPDFPSYSSPYGTISESHMPSLTQGVLDGRIYYVFAPYQLDESDAEESPHRQPNASFRRALPVVLMRCV